MEFKGDVKSFDSNWKDTGEAHYLHWCRGKPTNQVQFAFRQHWLTFIEILGKNVNAGSVLEVGCGRGSLSAYFADAGWECTLLDLSANAIELAEVAFAKTGFTAQFDVGDCLSLPYGDNEYDVVFSIGLLEHFENISAVLVEQLRVLKPGGTFFGYVVPDMPYNLQKDFHWINDILKALIGENAASEKSDIFRSDLMSPPYIEEMTKLGFKNINSSGIYSVPMISHSPAFPFSLMPEAAEEQLVKHFERQFADKRALSKGSNPWLCEEGVGQAFLLWAQKER